MKAPLQIGNVLALVFAVVMNILVGAQLLDLPAINTVSDKYATLLTPANYAFSIWSLIYVLLVVFVIYQARDTPHARTQESLAQKAGPYFIIASICNGLWTLVFVKEWVALSVLVLLLLAASLYRLIWRLGVGQSAAKRNEIVCVWWPLELYAGWVTVATTVNIASWLKFSGFGLAPFAACLVLVALGAGLLWLLCARGLRELVLAAAWGIVAVGVRVLHMRQSVPVAVAAFCVSALLLAAVGLHAYKNRRNLLPR